jgi:hypothetical protein
MCYAISELHGYPQNMMVAPGMTELAQQSHKKICQIFVLFFLVWEIYRAVKN